MASSPEIPPTNSELKAQKKSKLPFNGLLHIVPFVSREMLLFFAIVLFYGINALCTMAYARVFEGIDEALEADDFATNIFIPLALLIITFLRASSLSLGGIVSAYISNMISYRLSNKVYSHLMNLPIKFFDRSSVGEIMSKVGFNVGSITAAVSRGLITIVRECLIIVALLGYLIYLNWQLTLILAVIFPVVVVVMDLVRRRLKVLSKRLKEGNERLSRLMVDVLSAPILVRIFAAESYESQRFKQHTRYIKQESLKTSLVTAIANPIFQILVALPISFIMYLGLSNGANSFDDVGKFLAYIAACSLLAPPLRALSGVQAVLQAGEIAAKDYIHYLSLEQEHDSGRIILDSKKLEGKIEFHNVTFGYNDSVNVLEKFNIVFEKGQKCALVGMSGSGKSTIVNLIMRLYGPQSGHISLDNNNIRDIQLSSLRRSISYVGQEVFLFNDTLRNNILYGVNDKEAISDEMIKDVLQNASAWDFVDELADGLDSRIGEKGVKLSGGQQQRLSIARSLIKGSKLIIMDEATSALDVKTEYEIKRSIKLLMEGSTAIIIAHRLSTIESMDKIILLEDGKVVGEGRHEDLVENNESYADLCSYQYKD
ncbi:MAG: ABC transporter ATP-binding protein/permease [Gammaproteobacteria bacterium]|nr:ABC transporter ATP-binding protein/permease [Gammaproteobacteria bacterium]